MFKVKENTQFKKKLKVKAKSGNADSLRNHLFSCHSFTEGYSYITSCSISKNSKTGHNLETHCRNFLENLLTIAQKFLFTETVFMTSFDIAFTYMTMLFYHKKLWTK